ncbi:hypothetical protein UT300019_33760 [Clostridium sp. CTA-19]
MKRKSKIISALLIGASVTALGTTVFAVESNKTIKEKILAGETRYESAVAVSKEGWETSENAILVNSTALVDALAATPYAKMKNAPILLTEKDNLTEATKEELVRLGVNNITIVGGNNVVSKNVEKTLSDMGIKVERLSGNDRYETSLNVAKVLDIKSVAIVNGMDGRLADAMSIAAPASENDMAIVLSDGNSLKGVENFIKENKTNETYVIGGQSVISNNIEISLNAKRLGGENRLETNAKVLKEFYESKDIKNIYLTKDGSIQENQLVDALSAGPLAAKESSPVMLIGNELSKGQKEFLSSKQIQTIMRVGHGINHKTIEEIYDVLKVVRAIDVTTLDEFKKAIARAENKDLIRFKPKEKVTENYKMKTNKEITVELNEAHTGNITIDMPNGDVINNGDLQGKVIIDDIKDGTFLNKGKVKDITVNDINGAAIANIEKGKISKITVGDKTKLSVSGKISEVIIDGKEANLKLIEKSEIEKLEMNENSKGSKIENNGKIKTVKIDKNVTDIKIDTEKGKIDKLEGNKDVISSGKNNVGTITSPSSGGSSGGSSGSGSNSDTEAPIIKLKGKSTITIENGGEYKEEGVTITDNKDKNLKAEITYTKDGEKVEKIDTKIGGTYKVHYNVKDAAGNKAKEVIRTVIVKEEIDKSSSISEAPLEENITVINNSNGYSVVKITGLHEDGIVKVYSSSTDDEYIGWENIYDEEAVVVIRNVKKLDKEGGKIYVTVTSKDKKESRKVEKEYISKEKTSDIIVNDIINTSSIVELRDVMEKYEGHLIFDDVRGYLYENYFNLKKIKKDSLKTIEDIQNEIIYPVNFVWNFDFIRVWDSKNIDEIDFRNEIKYGYTNNVIKNVNLDKHFENGYMKVLSEFENPHEDKEKFKTVEGIQKFIIDAGAARFVTDEINTLPELDNVSLENQEEIIDARESFDELSKEQKDLVNKESEKKLNNLEKELDELKGKIEVDTEAPIIRLKGKLTITIENGGTYKEEGVTIIDNKDKDLKVEITYTKDGEEVEKIDTKIGGIYKVHYNVKDEAENKAKEVIRTVIVSEETISRSPLVENITVINNSDGCGVVKVTGLQRNDTVKIYLSIKDEAPIAVTNAYNDEVIVSGINGLEKDGGRICITLTSNDKEESERIEKEYISQEDTSKNIFNEIIQTSDLKQFKKTMYKYRDGIYCMKKFLYEDYFNLKEIKKKDLKTIKDIQDKVIHPANIVWDFDFSRSWDYENIDKRKFYEAIEYGNEVNILKNVNLDKYFEDGYKKVVLEFKNPHEDRKKLETVEGIQRYIIDAGAARFGTDKINSLPELNNVNLKDEEVINDARKSFDELSKEQQELVNEKSKNKLNSLEKKLDELRNGITVDEEAPIIKLKGNTTIIIENGADYKEEGVTITDNKDKDLKAEITYTKDEKEIEKIDTEIAGTYEVHYNAKDAAGNKAEEVIRIVIVSEETISIPLLAENITIINNSNGCGVIKITGLKKDDVVEIYSSFDDEKSINSIMVYDEEEVIIKDFEQLKKEGGKIYFAVRSHNKKESEKVEKEYISQEETSINIFNEVVSTSNVREFEKIMYKYFHGFCDVRDFLSENYFNLKEIKSESLKTIEDIQNEVIYSANTIEQFDSSKLWHPNKIDEVGFHDAIEYGAKIKVLKNVNLGKYFENGYMKVVLDFKNLMEDMEKIKTVEGIQRYIIDEGAARFVTDKISVLPELSDVNLKDEEVIIKTKEYFDELSKEQQELVNEESKDKLAQLEEKINELKEI